MTGWAITTTPQAGDIFAYKWNYSGATGHVGVYAGSGVGIWANDRVIRMDSIKAAFSADKFSAIIYRTYIGSPK